MRIGSFAALRIKNMFDYSKSELKKVKKRIDDLRRFL